MNKHRGEVGAILNDQPMTLCLTLGALAELEAAFQVDDLISLASRFENGQLSSNDIIIILTCGLKGAGHAVCQDDVAIMKCEGGLTGFANLAAELLEATFGGKQAGNPQTRP